MEDRGGGKWGVIGENRENRVLGRTTETAARGREENRG